MTNAPIVSWYEGENKKINEVKNVVNFGVVDADSSSPQKVFYIWNNRAGAEDCSKMEEVKYTTRDRQGGLGETEGAKVEAVYDNWFHVKCDTLNDTTYVPVGRGNSINPTGDKALGTGGATKNIDELKAAEWQAETILGLGSVVGVNSTDFIYIVTKAGTTGATMPNWVTEENGIVLDGTVEYTAVAKEKRPGAEEILGLKNSTDENGTNAEDAAGNFVKISVYADVPITASAGKNELLQRVSFRYV